LTYVIELSGDPHLFRVQPIERVHATALAQSAHQSRRQRRTQHQASRWAALEIQAESSVRAEALRDRARRDVVAIDYLP